MKKNLSAFIEEKSVWMDSMSSLIFNETSNPEISTIASFSSGDMHRQSREPESGYHVNTISLIDLLIKYNAPDHIDYLSIDIQVSKFPILESLNSEKFSLSMITGEHAYRAERENT